ncbi:hypothetical protein ACGE24_05120 [Corynebacterium kroppenstedtii]|uniref:hypothetical protein n=1 Tax=Corynebacterium sp. PCR 32 TaxID=3351342 RepID=UPI0030B0E748
MSLKSASLRSGLAIAAAGSALTLGACGAGQISQTANQVPAVDGAAANAENNTITLRDVTVQPKTDDHAGAVAFTISNVDPSQTQRTLQRIKVDGKEVKIEGNTDLKPQCQIIGNNKDALKGMGAHEVKATSSTSESTADSKGGSRVNCVSYIRTSFNGSPTPGTSTTVTFTLNTGDITLTAPVAEAVPQAGQTSRDHKGVTKDKSDKAKDDSNTANDDSDH